MNRYANLCLILLAVLPLSYSRAASKDTRPNILFIFTDDQSHRTVSCYPEAHPWVRTPNIDRLAEEGLRFASAYCGPWCMPARAMTLTGLQLHAIRGVNIKPKPFIQYDPNVCRFWPAELRKAGYQTAFIGKWHFSSKAGHGRDWDHSIVWNHVEPKKAGSYYLDQKLSFDGGPYTPVGGYSTDNYTRYAEKFIQRDYDRPWLLWLCYDAPHIPYVPAERHQDQYKNEPVPIPLDIWPPRPTKPRYMQNFCLWQTGIGPNANHPIRQKTKVYAGPRIKGPERANPKYRLDEIVRKYNRVVSAIDEGVGRLIRTLEQSGQLDNTLVVFTSDQGIAFGQHGCEGKFAPYDANIRVPMLIRMPGQVAKAKICRHPVGVLDLIVTFFAMAETPLPWKLHGHDLSSILKDPDAPWPYPVMLESFGWWMGADSDGALTGKELWGGGPWWLSLRQGRYKYIRTLIENEIEELYDLKADPEELTNLAVDPKHHVLLADFRQRLVQELKRTDAPLVNNLPEPKTVSRTVSSSGGS